MGNPKQKQKLKGRHRPIYTRKIKLTRQVKLIKTGKEWREEEKSKTDTRGEERGKTGQKSKHHKR